ncbi:hypothetical protein VB715_18965 [Crocosphaera sp. UHCC 0190]|uniref:hypothetical protein n=1 Tax=Crocosphaera sp. UHCC 0190 TaxID=3110246 RepID=UPI002B210275|nr:hypothetical protein [Crocosphaera sp. UHCC 0190]MEA5511857.1 hypothetical protein [Crocosphaera sp. UHCC 0190]
MKKITTFLGFFTGTTLTLLMGNTAASAASFNLSYTTAGGSMYTGMLDGDLQLDENTINVTSFIMSQLNGSSLPETPIVRSSSGSLGSLGIVSLNGSIMNLGACTNTTCNSGIFIGNLGFEGGDLFSATTAFGPNFEPFESSRWTLTEKPPIPEPSVTLALVSLGLVAVAKSSLKKQ